jgi:Transglutaminase-like superfamily
MLERFVKRTEDPVFFLIHQIRSRSQATAVAVAARKLPETFILVLLAYLYLVRFDLLLAYGDFAKFHGKVRGYRVSGISAPDSADRICAAVDIASIFYWKRILCLQRSAATTCLLKSFGVPAQMMIGAQQMPFKAHAWVEVEGRVVSDKPYMREIYTVLDHC